MVVSRGHELQPPGGSRGSCGHGGKACPVPLLEVRPSGEDRGEIPCLPPQPGWSLLADGLEKVVFSGRAGKGPAVGPSWGPGCRETRSRWDSCSPQWPCWSSRPSLPRRATRPGHPAPLTLGAPLTLQALMAGDGASPPAHWELSQVCVGGAVAPFQAVDDLLGFRPPREGIAANPPPGPPKPPRSTVENSMAARTNMKFCTRGSFMSFCPVDGCRGDSSLSESYNFSAMN